MLTTDLPGNLRFTIAGREFHNSAVEIDGVMVDAARIVALARLAKESTPSVEPPLGARPPPNLEWQIGQTAASIRGGTAPTPEQAGRQAPEWLCAVLPESEGSVYVDLPSGKVTHMEGAQPAQPLYRHVKTGGLYRVLAEGEMEGTRAPVVIYRGDTGTWVRDRDEFYDGRFERVGGA